MAKKDTTTDPARGWTVALLSMCSRTDQMPPKYAGSDRSSPISPRSALFRLVQAASGTVIGCPTTVHLIPTHFDG